MTAEVEIYRPKHNIRPLKNVQIKLRIYILDN